MGAGRGRSAASHDPPFGANSSHVDNGLQFLARLLRRRDRLSEAAAVYERILRDFPDNGNTPIAAYEFGSALADAGERARAAEVLEKAVRSFPDRREAPEARRRLEELRSADEP